VNVCVSVLFKLPAVSLAIHLMVWIPICVEFIVKLYSELLLVVVVVWVVPLGNVMFASTVFTLLVTSVIVELHTMFAGIPVEFIVHVSGTTKGFVLSMVKFPSPSRLIVVLSCSGVAFSNTVSSRS